MLTTTQWTVVFRAAKEDSRAERPALGELMTKYWQPLYFFARRQGLSPADAEDATQAFLAEVIEGNSLAAADPAKGRFRTYLLTLWKRFLIDRARSENRLKRGGGVAVTTLYGDEGEKAWLRWSTHAPTESNPDRAYYEQWASTMIDSTLEKLRTEYSKSHRQDAFQILLPFLSVPIGADTYRDLAGRLRSTEGAAKVALHRLRQRFAQTLRDCVHETLDDPHELDSEINELMQYLLRRNG